MGNKLEQLLNSLIEKGWKPYEYQTIERVKMVGTLGIMFITKDNEEFSGFNIRMLTSKESNLWQFVCENMLINKKWFYGDEYCIAEHCVYIPKYYKFRLIESALTDESELEDFLLNSIKLD